MLGRRKDSGVGTLSVGFTLLLRVLVHDFADRQERSPSFVLLQCRMKEPQEHSQPQLNPQDISHQTSPRVRESSMCQGTPLWAMAQATGAPDEPCAGSRPTQAHEDVQPGCETEGMCPEEHTAAPHKLPFGHPNLTGLGYPLVSVTTGS